MALGTRRTFHLEILTINVIFGIVYFRGIILESYRNVSETTPWSRQSESNGEKTDYWDDNNNLFYWYLSESRAWRNDNVPYIYMGHD